jgi:hypothetical protein
MRPADLNSKGLQYRLVEVEGIVRSAGIGRSDRAFLTLFGNGRPIRVAIRDSAGFDSQALVDAAVRIKGVLRLSLGAAGEPINAELAAQSLGDLQIVQAPPPLTQIPWRSVAEIHTAEAHRIRLRGTVSHGGDGLVFRDAHGSIALFAGAERDVPQGEGLEITAFVSEEDGKPILTEGAVVDEDSGKAGTRKVFKTLGEIRRLSSAELARGYTAQIQGVVTYSDPVARDTFVQDESGGAYVFAPSAGKLDLQVGQVVSVRGFIDPGGFAPAIVEPRVEVLGRHALPAPLPLDMEELLTGVADSRWVEVQGTVRWITRDAGRLRLSVVWGSHRFLVNVAGITEAPPWLLNSRLRIRGVCGTVTNLRRQLLGIQIFVPSMSFLERQGPAVADHLPLLRIEQLLGFSTELNRDQRARTRGTVIFSRPMGPTYLSDSTGGLFVRTHAPIDLKEGDLVEVTGTTRRGDVAPFLEDAEVVN